MAPRASRRPSSRILSSAHPSQVAASSCARLSGSSLLHNLRSQGAGSLARSVNRAKVRAVALLTWYRAAISYRSLIAHNPSQRPLQHIHSCQARSERFGNARFFGESRKTGLEVTIPDRAVVLQQFIDGLLILWRNGQCAPTEEWQAGLRFQRQSRVPTPPTGLDFVPTQ
jgi:hypothetical protein